MPQKSPFFPRISWVLSLALGPFSAFGSEAAVGVLKAPEVVQVMTVDGEDASGALFGSRDYSRKLTPGEHVLSVRYNQLFNLGTDDYDILKSPPVAFRFVVEAGKTYQLQTEAPKRYQDAKTFAKNPVIRLVDVSSGNAIDGVMVKSLGQASLMDTIGKAFQSASAEDESAAPKGSATLNRLRELWSLATPAERQAFAAWLASQTAAKP